MLAFGPYPKTVLRHGVSLRAMITAQWHYDRAHPAPWRAAQDRRIVGMLTHMLGKGVIDGQGRVEALENNRR